MKNQLCSIRIILYIHPSKINNFKNDSFNEDKIFNSFIIMLLSCTYGLFAYLILFDCFHSLLESVSAQGRLLSSSTSPRFVVVTSKIKLLKLFHYST